jgi:phosphate butyryltransferase
MSCFKNLAEMVQAVKAKKYMKRCAVFAAEDRYTLEAVFSAYRDGIIVPLLIGDKRRIRDILSAIDCDHSDITVIHADSPEESVQKAAGLIHAGDADCMMKGHIGTRTMVRTILNETTGLRTERLMSALATMEIPTYHKLLASTDGGINLYPTLEQKKMIIENAVGELRKFGIDKPKVAVLAAVEVVNPRMPETIDACELKKMNERGEIKDCIVEGPISYDIAISREAAETKDFESPVAGDADLLVWPNITCGNLTTEVLVRSCRTKVGSYIVGAKVPILIASRAADPEEIFLSIVFGVASLG